MIRIKATSIIFFVTSAIIIAACGTSRKSTTAIATPIPPQPLATKPPLPPVDNFPFLKTANGVFAPGNEELVAITTQYKDVTLEKLNEGYILYTQGACINCHAAKGIYNRGEEQWYNIIENMAPMAKLTDAQKDAVYKYVLAIKATQPR